MTVFSFADENHSGKLAAFEDQFLVDAQRWIFIADDFRAVILVCDFPRRKNIYAHDLQLRSENASLVCWTFISGNRRGEDFSLFNKRSDQSITNAVMLHTFADCEDVGAGSLHVVVDDDAALHFEP